MERPAARHTGHTRHVWCGQLQCGMASAGAAKGRTKQYPAPPRPTPKPSCDENSEGTGWPRAELCHLCGSSCGLTARESIFLPFQLKRSSLLLNARPAQADRNTRPYCGFHSEADGETSRGPPLLCIFQASGVRLILLTNEEMKRGRFVDSHVRQAVMALWRRMDIAPLLAFVCCCCDCNSSHGESYYRISFLKCGVASLGGRETT